MQIEISLFASLRKYKKEPRYFLDITEGTLVKDLLSSQEIPLHEAKVILVNGIGVEHNSPLKDGDKVSIFPLLGGG